MYVFLSCESSGFLFDGDTLMLVFFFFLFLVFIWFLEEDNYIHA